MQEINKSSNIPNFLCIGAQKSGTTLLYELLKELPNVYLPKKKELHFFDTDENFKKGIKYYQEKYFKNSLTYSAVGEVTPSYIFIDKVAKRIRNKLGENVKLILLIRNPTERAYSHYAMKFKQNQEKNSFEKALALEEVRTKEDIENSKKYAYKKRGLYSEQLEIYLNYFKLEQFLFIKFEDLVLNQDKTVSEICNFLNITKTITLKNKIVHATKLTRIEYIKFNLLNNKIKFFANLQIDSLKPIQSNYSYPEMSNKTKNYLLDYYKKDIRKLEILINKDLSAWLE